MKTVSERAIVARVNRKLAVDNERVSILRHGNARYRHADVRLSIVLGDFDDLESFAKECGVLAANESIAY